MRQGDFLFKGGTTRKLASYWSFHLKREKWERSFPAYVHSHFDTNVIAAIHISILDIHYSFFYIHWKIRHQRPASIFGGAFERVKVDRSRCGSGITCRGDSQGRVDSLFLIIDRRRQQYSRSRRGPFTRTHLRLIAFQGQRNDGSGGTNGPIDAEERTSRTIFFFLLAFLSFLFSFSLHLFHSTFSIYICIFVSALFFVSVFVFFFFFHFRELRNGRLMIKLKPPYIPL